LAVFLAATFATAAEEKQPPPGASTNPPSKFKSEEDGWLDVSGFLDERYGFIPLMIPITEPAVGYGAGVALAFIDKPLGEAQAGFGRPDITAVGGLGTENGTWGAMAGNVSHWLDDSLQTTVGLIHASVNLDFNGIGQDAVLNNHPLSYNLEPSGGIARVKYRLGHSYVWAGLSYAFASTRVTFDAPARTPGLPDIQRESHVGGLTPSLTYDSRDNIFTPTRGTYVEAGVGLFSQALGGDGEFQRASVTAMHFLPLVPKLTLGVREDAAFSFGDVPFYLRPFISLRGVPVMRYQGEDTAQVEAELRWQLWKRFSLVGFVGAGCAWNHFEHLDNSLTVITGGGGFSYEIARKYGLHMGVDLAFGPGTTAIYVQFGSAWARP
jgi:outer membrane protein assembly factor BamA